MASPVARAWWIHGLVLAGMSVVYLVVTWEAWFPPPNRGWNLDGLGAVLFFMMLSIYAFVSTLIVAVALQRRPLGVVILHVLAIAGYAVAMWFDSEDTRRFAEEQARAQESEREAAHAGRLLETCLRIVDVVARPRPILQVDVTLANGCPFAVEVGHAALEATDERGEQRTLRYPDAPRTPLAPGATAVRTVQEFMPEEQTDDASKWSWRATVWVAAPQEKELCFVSDDAPGKARCGPLTRPLWAP